MKNNKKLPTKAQVLALIEKDWENPIDIKTNFAGSLSNIKTNSLIKTNKSEEDLFWEEYQKEGEENERKE